MGAHKNQEIRGNDVFINKIHSKSERERKLTENGIKMRVSANRKCAKIVRDSAVAARTMSDSTEDTTVHFSLVRFFPSVRT